jgi:hypothetical protein
MNVLMRFLIILLVIVSVVCCVSLPIEDSFEREKAFEIFSAKFQLHKGNQKFVETTSEVKPVDGAYALKISVAGGMAANIGRSCPTCKGDIKTERNEISFGDPLGMWGVEELWYQYSFYLPSSYPKNESWNIVHQYKEWESERYSNHPVCKSISPFYYHVVHPYTTQFAFDVQIDRTRRIEGTCNHERLKTSHIVLEYDIWYTVRTHMVYDRKENGVVETWIDGNKIMEHHGVVGQSEIGSGRRDFRIGIYRESVDQGTASIYFDDVKIARTLAELES